MEQITGPVSYQKIVIPELGKIIHMFGDRHERTEECKHKSYLLEQVVENTIDHDRDRYIDVFYEEGYGSIFLNERMNIKKAEHIMATYDPLYDDPSVYQDALERKNIPFELENSSYIHSFINYFVNSADCFMKPRQPTCSERYPNARFHSIDLRDTLRTECIELLTEIRIQYPRLRTLFNNTDYQWHLSSNFNELLTILHDYSGPKKELAHFIHNMISLRIKRFRKERDIDSNYQLKIKYPVGIDEYDFFEELAAVILEPESEPLYCIKKLYKSISHVQDKTLHAPLRQLVDDTITRIRTMYSSDLLHVSMAFLHYKGQQSHSIYKKSGNQEAKDDYMRKKNEFYELSDIIMLITVPILDLYALIRMMKSNYQYIIMYYGNDHTNNIVDLLIHLFPTIKLSPLYTNNDKQCLTIPMQDGMLSFTQDVDINKPFKYGFTYAPMVKASPKDDEPYPSQRLEELRRVVDQKRVSSPYVPLLDENRMYHLPKEMGKRSRRRHKSRKYLR